MSITHTQPLCFPITRHKSKCGICLVGWLIVILVFLQRTYTHKQLILVRGCDGIGSVDCSIEASTLGNRRMVSFRFELSLNHATSLGKVRHFPI